MFSFQISLGSSGDLNYAGQANWSHLKYFFKSSSTSVVRENAAMHRFAVKLQNFFVGYKTSADFFGRVCKDN